MSTLITGANGFVGKNLKGDFFVDFGDADLTNYSETVKMLERFNPNIVIHCAARHGSATELTKKHVDYIENNITSDLNIIKACRQTGVESLLMLSTITSFPPTSPSPFKEEYFDGSVNEKFFGYAYSKKVCIGLCKAYQIDFGLNYKCVFLGNVYGPHNRFDDNSTVVSNLIYKFTKAKDINGDVNLFGDGKDVRNYIYVEDLNYIFPKIIKNKNIKNPIIVSSAQENSIIDIIDIITKEINFKGKVIFNQNISIGDKVKVSDISKLKEVVGDYKFTLLEDGIKKTIDWYLKNNS